MREMQSSKSPFRASFITMSSPDAAWSIELLMGVNGRLAQSWPTHSPPAPAWSLPGPHQATCWKGNQVRKGSWLSEGEGRRPVWTNRGVFTDVGEGQALCPGSVSAHSETRLPKTGLSQGPLAMLRKILRLNQADDKAPDCKERYQPECGVGRAARQVLCLSPLSLQSVRNDTHSPACQGTPAFSHLFLKQPHDVGRAGSINPIFQVREQHFRR